MNRERQTFAQVLASLEHGDPMRPRTTMLGLQVNLLFAGGSSEQMRSRMEFLWLCLALVMFVRLASAGLRLIMDLARICS